MNPDVHDIVIDLVAGDLDDVWVKLGSNRQEDDCDLGGHNLVCERSPSILDSDNGEEGVGPGREQRGSYCGTLLERV